MPDHLFKRAKQEAAKRKTTLRRLVIDALEQNLSKPSEVFHLRDASVGGEGETTGPTVSNETINHLIDEQREGSFHR